MKVNSEIKLKLKKVNRIVIILLLSGILVFVGLEWAMDLLGSEDKDWQPVNAEIETIIDLEHEPAPAPPPMININTASAAQLTELPGIGPSKAQAIIDDRSEKGTYEKLEDIKRVKGIGDATFEGMRAQIILEEAERE